jgi:hypothetical protein
MQAHVYAYLDVFGEKWADWDFQEIPNGTFIRMGNPNMHTQTAKCMLQFPVSFILFV